MASINEYGGTSDKLAAPALGGAGGWCEAVVSVLGSDAPVDQRISEAIAAAVRVRPGGLVDVWDGTQWLNIGTGTPVS